MKQLKVILWVFRGFFVVLAGWWGFDYSLKWNSFQKAWPIMAVWGVLYFVFSMINIILIHQSQLRRKK